MKKTIHFDGMELTIKNHRYRNGRLAIQLLDGSENFATLTVNVPDGVLEEGEFFVKTYSDNAAIAMAARASGHFIDTGKRFQVGMTFAEIWRWAK